MSEKAPLKNPDVEVVATPRHESNHSHVDTARRVRDNLRQAVKKAIEDNKDNGHQAQVDAATRTAKTVRDADPRQIEKVKVTVTGTDPDGDRVTHRITVTPGQEKKQ